MADKRVNVLVYSGNGSTIESVKHCLWSLRRLLGPNYAVIPMTGETLLKEPWQATCALFVMPGGADLGYCRTLDGPGNRLISSYVKNGGKYLGLCAGGYYGSARCEFEVGRTGDGYEVVGDRELAFFPGTCRGLAFPEFVYQSEKGTRAAEISVNRQALISGGGAVPEVLRVYHNGGGVFVDAEKFEDRGVEILANYTERLHVDSGDGKAAVVHCKVGNGAAILTGPHPEFSAVNLNDKGKDRPDYPRIVEALLADDQKRIDFMKACLSRLGLQVNQTDDNIPSLSRLHLSSARPQDISDLVSSWSDIIEKDEDGKEIVKDEHDTFVVEREAPSSWSMSGVVEALPEAVQNILPESVRPEHYPHGTDKEKAKSAGDHSSAPKETASKPTEEGIVDYQAIPKRVVVHTSSIPEPKETPYFNHAAYYSSHLYFGDLYSLPQPTFGKTLLYGETVTSTNTILEKNTRLLETLSNGTTATATTQLAGRGRGNNVWVSPPGSLMFSTVIRHPLSLNSRAPVVFVQYILALAIVAGVKKYDPNHEAYENLPIRLKWPNDIYALHPSFATASATSANEDNNNQNNTTDAERNKFTKIGGILINSSYSSGDYTLVCGVGMNVTNPHPTTSLNALAAAYDLPPFNLERLLASILIQFEKLHLRFLVNGFSDAMVSDYEDVWLHSGQVVRLENEEGYPRARILGVTRDWGLLVAEEVVVDEYGYNAGGCRATGRKFELQSDANSFDFFKGLVRRKV